MRAGLWLAMAMVSLMIASSQERQEPAGRAVVFLREQCAEEGPILDRAALKRYATARNRSLPDDLEVTFVPKTGVCESKSRGLSAILDALSQEATRGLIGSLEEDLCDVTSRLAEMWGKPLVSWTCPQVTKTTNRPSLVPSLEETANAVVAVAKFLGWKSILIITSDVGWWPALANKLEVGLQDLGLAPRHIYWENDASPKTALRALLNTHPKVVILCASLISSVGELIVQTIDGMRFSQSILLAVDVSSFAPFLPDDSDDVTAKRVGTETVSGTKKSWSRYEMSANTSTESKRSFVMLTSMDSKNVTSETFDPTPRIRAYEHILDGLDAMRNFNESERARVFEFLLMDWHNDEWRPLMIVETSKNTTGGGGLVRLGEVILNMVKIAPNFEEWYRSEGHEHDDDSCDDDFCIRAQIKMNSTHIIIIVGSAVLFCALFIGLVVVLRNMLLKKRLSKGPNKVVLTATDFVFPQVSDSRRVDEGIEAMLCCWLQQLQEFGGPEVDKPDLLKGSVGSLKGPGAAKGPSSNGSLAKNNYIVDHRIRYNGDLVQLKELPTSGTFELKSKAMDCLVLTQGLRHENLNPFIGCLTDPARPALVHEHCSRGSLEDVLMMDEIKLDWTFRLSLLTDLVRGMRYLHSTPLKVHGYLTSRNCVIDARWVLKVTDYGLPAFYEAQGVPPKSKNARDLLWTAPELLRHCGLRRRGSQAGDVYSFAIIMQEVVVRGEPFCMLALSPEEIIEKVKKPPPLIRPSVSKGAAPPEAINIMRQCWTEQPEMRPDFCQVHDLFRKLNHGRKVNFVDTMFQMLEKYSNNLEELIKERTEQLDMEKKKTEQLLNRMLPSSVAEKLKLGMPVDPEEFSEVSIYFSDIVGFTAISAHCTPFQVVDLLNDLYTCFDATINAYNVYKVETIGDAYMVVGGLPVKIPDHAEQIATMALDLLHQAGKFKIRHLPRTPLHLRIGLHTGPCCAGVVGLTMPRYCLFGDTVNTASRMESTGTAWRIHISQATRDKLEAAGGYSIEYRGKTELKGKGRLPTYWLLGKAGFEKPLPKAPPIGESNCLEESLSVIQTEVVSVLSSPAHSSAAVESAEKHSSDLIPTEDSEDTRPTPVSASELAAALLGGPPALTTRYKDVAKYKRSVMFENHYKCISPSDSHINQLNQAPPARQAASRLLKRQFSLDRADDPSAQPAPDPVNRPQHQPKLCKQNSAGAASDLERIEEVPLANLPSPRNYKRLLATSALFAGTSKSVSDESLENR